MVDDLFLFAIPLQLLALSLATLSSDVDQGSLGAHDASGAIGIVAEAGGVTYEETFRIFQQRVKGIRILAAIVPGIDTAHGYDRLRKRVFQEIVDQIDSMA